MHLIYFSNYFKKKVNNEISQLYTSSAIGNLALSMVMLFEPIFLYKVLGFTVPDILFFFFAVYLVYVFFIAWGAKVAEQYGYKHAVAISAAFQILYWLLLVIAKQNPNVVFLAAVAFGLQKSLYWPGFHSLMAKYADRGQVGREFGVVYAIVSVCHIVGPFLGGILSFYFDPAIAFVFAAVVYVGSIIPLFKHKEIFVPKAYKFSQSVKYYKKFPLKALGYMGFGEELLMLVVWPVFIYLTVQNFQGTGLVATIASFLAAVLAVIIGKVTDRYAKKVLIRAGAFFTFLVWLGKILSGGVWNIFALDTLTRTSKEMTFIPISTEVYIDAEHTSILPFVVFFEQSLAIGKLLTCLLGIVIFSFAGGFTALWVLGAVLSLFYILIQ